MSLTLYTLTQTSSQYDFLLLRPLKPVMNSPKGDHVRLDTNVYALTAIKKAIYRLADRASFLISPEEGSNVIVTITPPSGCDTSALAAAFLTELADQDLREIIRAETTPLRNLILAHAFSRSSLVKES